MGNGRARQMLSKVKFKQLVDLKLDNKEYRPAREGAGAICLQELSLVFSCLKLSNFKEEACAEELKNFNKCYKETIEQKKGVSMRRIGRKKISDNDLNNLITKYPNM